MIMKPSFHYSQRTQVCKNRYAGYIPITSKARDTKETNAAAPGKGSLGISASSH